MREFFERNQRVALLFSGGRDSLACLMLCREYWAQITVVWCNPGNPYPETVEQMSQVRAMVPNFIEVRGRQPEYIRERGYPVDVVPLSMTVLGRAIGRRKGALVVPYFDCCNENLWRPASEHITQGGYTGIIRGDKQSDLLKPPVSSGQRIDGIEYLFPVEAWTDEQVQEFVGPWLPQSYRRGVRTSLDCMNCTAYLTHNAERIADLKSRHPKVHREVVGVLGEVSDGLREYANALGQQAGGAM